MPFRQSELVTQPEDLTAFFYDHSAFLFVGAVGSGKTTLAKKMSFRTVLIPAERDQTFEDAVQRFVEAVVERRVNRSPDAEDLVNKVNELWSDFARGRRIDIEDQRVAREGKFVRQQNCVILERDEVGGFVGAALANRLSKGEKTALSIIITVLLAVPAAVIIVDEPEAYLDGYKNRKFWSRIMDNRSDCVFLFFTHDLRFALSVEGRTANFWGLALIHATKFVSKLSEQYSVSYPSKLPVEVQSFVDWEPCASLSLAEAAQIDGRRTLLFVEGHTKSLDTRFYRALLPDFRVFPAGGHNEVKNAVADAQKFADIHLKSEINLRAKPQDCAGIFG